MSGWKTIVLCGLLALLLAGCLTPGTGPEGQGSSQDDGSPSPNLSPDPTLALATTPSATPTPTSSSVPPSQPIVYILWYETAADPQASSSPGPHCPKSDGWVHEDHVEIDQGLFHELRDEPALLFQVAKLEPDFDWTSAYRASVSPFPVDHRSGRPDAHIEIHIDHNATSGTLLVDGEEVDLPYRWSAASEDGNSRFEGNLTLGPERSEVRNPSPGCT